MADPLEIENDEAYPEETEHAETDPVETENVDTYPVETEHVENLARKLYRQVLDKSAMTDFKLRAGKQSVKCHKAVLCAVSTYLSGLCERGECEANIAGSVTLGSEEREALNAIVRYIYLGSTDMSINILPFLLESAEILEMPTLKENCEIYMTAVLNRDNCSEIEDIALKYKLTDVKEQCWKLKNDKFNDASEGEPGVTLPKLKKIVEKIVVCGGMTTGNKRHENIVIVGDYKSSAKIACSTFKDHGYYSVSASKDTFFISGGYKMGTRSGEVKAYNILKNEWRPVPDMPHRRSDHASVCHQNNLYIVGGDDSKGKTVDTMYVLVNASGKWKTCKAMIKALFRPCVSVVEDSIICCGGWDGGIYSLMTSKYDISHNKWSECSDMPQFNAHAHNSIASLKQRVYVLSYDNFLMFDVPNNQWSQLAPPPLPSTYCAMVAYRGRLLALGGDVSDYHDKIHSYNPANESWCVERDTLPIPLCSHFAFALKLPK